ncbi:hypothetical protein [Variovorax sp. UC74_104]|uniref:hypothetical protein n=1 Tax=Variovorax sp. UC74_104 TaxID=3374555 RepID=UPI003756385B
MNEAPGAPIGRLSLSAMVTVLVTVPPAGRMSGECTRLDTCGTACAAVASSSAARGAASRAARCAVRRRQWPCRGLAALEDTSRRACACDRFDGVLNIPSLVMALCWPGTVSCGAAKAAGAPERAGFFGATPRGAFAIQDESFASDDICLLMQHNVNQM